MQIKNNKLMPYLASTVSCTIFGLSFLFSKRALVSADPFSLLSFRFLAAFLLLTILLFFKVIKVNYSNKPTGLLLLLGIMQPVIYFTFETFGLKYATSSQAGLIIALIPIVVTILSSVILNESPTLKQLLFIILSVSGVILIVLMGKGSSHSNTTMAGIPFLFCAVLSAAFFNILSRKISLHFTPIEITYFMMAMGAICFNVISLVLHINSGTLNSYFVPLSQKSFLISILYLGVLSSIIAFFLINFTLSKIEATKSTVFSNLSTIVSIFAGVIFQHDPFTVYHLIGSTMIILGVWGTISFGNKKIN